jgi:hypothetical protein
MHQSLESWQRDRKETPRNDKRGRRCRETLEAIGKGKPLKAETWVALA